MEATTRSSQLVNEACALFSAGRLISQQATSDYARAQHFDGERANDIRRQKVGLRVLGWPTAMDVLDERSIFLILRKAGRAGDGIDLGGQVGGVGFGVDQGLSVLELLHAPFVLRRDGGALGLLSRPDEVRAGIERR